MLYEFIVGPQPFGADTEDQVKIFRAILEEPLTFPASIKDEAAVVVIRALLERKPERRMGGSSIGAKEIKESSFYQGFNWDALAGGFFDPPWKPNQQALMTQWEPPDGEVMDHVSKESFGFSKGMEWAKDF